MNKHQLIRKNIIREGAFALAVIAILGAAAWLIDSHNLTKETEQRQLQSSLRTLAGQLSELEQKNGIASTSMTEFKRLKERQKHGDFLINREQARDIFDTLRKKHRIINLSLTVGPQEVQHGADIERPTAEITSSQMSLEFDALSDLHVFSFLQEAEQALPGFLKITSFNLTRQKEISTDTYVSLSHGEEPSMVTAKVNFLWLGIENKSRGNDGKK